ncbi:MAG: hypothetical protein SFV55_20410 [Haliscomenobacter sp.]|uniref:hypothetical protein n=1 Tax=Haliscomenobacter sp. TaxID=2717303 RepID=UPI0029AE86A6|nr:hypothetical protein [Haliscomenobacter sp.]MDX2070804.1 hypothetical protein [Haliscomenobacter sp.]
MSTFVVTATALNMRSEPKVTTTNRIALLPQGHLVSKIRVAPQNPDWFEISTILNGALFVGYVNGAFLAEQDSVVFPIFDQIGGVHLQPPKALRSVRGIWAYPLSETNMPQRDRNESVALQKQTLLDIVDWLDVTQSDRYQPGQNTYCNIYAYDYCSLAGAYLPRVWWNNNAIIKLLGGTEVSVKYGDSVYEVNANGLYNWLGDFGDHFGWQRLSNARELQAQVNQGKVGIISAENKSANNSGHIAVVIPEHDGFNATDNPFIPIQSQAGRVNRKKFNHLNWWTKPEFRAFGFWVHD